VEEETEENIKFITEDNNKKLGNNDSVNKDYIDKYNFIRINTEELETLKSGNNLKAGNT